MKFAIAVLFLSLCSCSLSSQWFFSEEQDADSVVSDESGAASKSTEEESDVWSIEVQAGQSATMSAAKGTTLKAPASTQPGEIPLYWRLPERTVTHYRIRYGATPNQLSATQEVTVAELAIVEDDIQGKMYRYLLRPAKEVLARTEKDELYYQVQAFNNSSASKPSPLTRGRLRSVVAPSP